jgi:hypothetical protein
MTQEYPVPPYGDALSGPLESQWTRTATHASASRTEPRSDSGAWILVTGSRNWRTGDHRTVMHQALTDTWTSAQRRGLTRLTVIHGAAAGADTMAARWTIGQPGVYELPFEARWTDDCGEHCRPGHRRRRADGTSYCPAAGAYRNQRMVNEASRHRGSVLVLAFWAQPKSDGTADAVRRAKRSLLPVRNLGRWAA